ncbi:MAG: hypothetical protein IPF90_13690 [Actinomycetales bacterium]|nr:hypothetical protein [Candidatus Phosphoribacter baldrii]
MTRTLPLHRSLCVVAMGILLALGACSSGGTTTAPPVPAASSPGGAAGGPGGSTAASSPAGAGGATGGSTPGKLDPAAKAPPASFTVKPPADPCAVLPMDAVKMFSLGKATATKAAPPNGCLYLNASGDVVFLYRLSTKEQLPGGLESLKNGAQSAMGAPATGILVRGFEGFVVTGQGTGTLETQVGVKVGDYVLECSVPKGGDLSDQRTIAFEAVAEILDAIVTVT